MVVNRRSQSLCFRLHQEVVEESFLPTVRTLMNAPATSPLAEVDINNVVELLVELTRPSGLIKPPANTEVREIRDQQSQTQTGCVDTTQPLHNRCSSCVCL